MCDSNVATQLLSGGELFRLMKKVVLAYLPPSMIVNWYLHTTQRNLPTVNLTRSSAKLGFGGALMMRSSSIDEQVIIPIG